jgi:hypothetical protein
MNTRIAVTLSFLLSGCAAPAHGPFNVDDRISDELARAAEQLQAPSDASRVQEALLPPLRVEIPAVPGQPI